MTRKKNGRDRCNGATRKAFYTADHNNIRSHIKAAIVRLALWGVLPVKLADWLIHRRGLRHA